MHISIPVDLKKYYPSKSLFLLAEKIRKWSFLMTKTIIL